MVMVSGPIQSASSRSRPAQETGGLVRLNHARWKRNSSRSLMPQRGPDRWRSRSFGAPSASSPHSKTTRMSAAGVGVAVGVGVGVLVGVGVAVGVGVTVGTGVTAGVGVGVPVGTRVAVVVGTGVDVGTGVLVGRGVTVGAGVDVDTSVPVGGTPVTMGCSGTGVEVGMTGVGVGATVAPRTPLTGVGEAYAVGEGAEAKRTSSRWLSRDSRITRAISGSSNTRSGSPIARKRTHHAVAVLGEVDVRQIGRGLPQGPDRLNERPEGGDVIVGLQRVQAGGGQHHVPPERLPARTSSSSDSSTNRRLSATTLARASPR